MRLSWGRFAMAVFVTVALSNLVYSPSQVGFAGAPLELNQDVVQTLNLYGLTAGFSVLDVVLDVALDDARSVRRIQKHAAELRRDDFGQVFVLSDDVDFVFGEFAEVKAILQGQHTLYSQSVSFRNRRDVRVRLVLVVGRNYLDSGLHLGAKVSPIISSRARRMPVSCHCERVRRTAGERRTWPTLCSRFNHPLVFVVDPMYRQ
jgi:hypothetical protein